MPQRKGWWRSPGCIWSFLAGEKNTNYIWVFPKIGVPPNHPFLIGFSIINHPFWAIPIFGNTHLGVNNFLTFQILDAWRRCPPQGFFPTETLGILYGPTALSKVFHQNGPFPPIGAFLPPTCLARMSRPNQVPHQSWPQQMSSSTETCTYNDTQRLMFFFATCSPHEKNNL